jgi:hypothetical protein
MTQNIFTIITDVESTEVGALRSVLGEINADPVANAVLPFGSFDVLHFASLTLVEKDDLAPTLIFEHNVDVSVDDWLRTLVNQAGAGIEALYTHCVGYPVGGDPAGVQAYLLAHVVPPGAFHIGATGRSLARLRQEAGLRNAIEGFLESEDASGRLRDEVPDAIRAAVQQFVRSDEAFSWTKKTPPRQTRSEHRRHQIRLWANVVAAAVVVPLLLPALAVGVVVLRLKERTDPVQEGPADPAHVKEVSDTEDFFAQNHLASVITVKPGLLRAVTLPVVLRILNLLARMSYTKGELGGIPSIHFAHWSVFDRGRQLLFLSNFDGSWESYLADFIDKAATGLTAVWSNTVNFPRTRFLVRDGATDGPRFRQWARSNQFASQVWYSAYPGLTMPMIDNNTAIREGLFAGLEGEEVHRWLQRL